jgi:AcrR family transcriptional regulator
MARPKQDERDEVLNQTRRALLDAAAAEIAAEGYVGANINRISKAAGFAKGTIYNYFASKRDLMRALLDDIAATHHDFMRERVMAEDDAESRLIAFFEAGFDFVIAHLPQAQVAIATVYGPDAAFNERLWEAYQPIFRLVAEEIIAIGIAQGTFRPTDAVQTAQIVMTVYLGTASQISPTGEFWLDRRRIADFVLRALH